MSETAHVGVQSRGYRAYKIMLKTLGRCDVFKGLYGPGRKDAANASEVIGLVLQKIEDLTSTGVEPDEAAQRVWDEVSPLIIGIFESIRAESHEEALTNFIATIRRNLSDRD